jgi:uncharacterized protein (TIGR03066 family)
MKTLWMALASGLVLGLAGISAADEKKDDKKTEETKKKLVGVWIAQEGGDMPAGSTLEFVKDGKLKVAVKIEDKTIEVEGTYEFTDADTLKVTSKDPEGKERSEKIKISKLSDSELVTVDEKDKKDTFKKKAK